MANVLDEMIRVHAILEEYVMIHNAIFKFSWRKAIPTPGVFKPIDYGRYTNGRGFLASELERLLTSLNAKPDLPEVFHQYTEALLQTVQFLHTMCTRLYEKSQGELGAYTMSEYRSDVSKYKGLANNYRSLGGTLNQ